MVWSLFPYRLCSFVVVFSASGRLVRRWVRIAAAGACSAGCWCHSRLANGLFWVWFLVPWLACVRHVVLGCFCSGCLVCILVGVGCVVMRPAWPRLCWGVFVHIAFRTACWAMGSLCSSRVALGVLCWVAAVVATSLSACFGWGSLRLGPPMYVWLGWVVVVWAVFGTPRSVLGVPCCDPPMLGVLWWVVVVSAASWSACLGLGALCCSLPMLCRCCCLLSSSPPYGRLVWVSGVFGRGRRFGFSCSCGDCYGPGRESRAPERGWCATPVSWPGQAVV